MSFFIKLRGTKIAPTSFSDSEDVEGNDLAPDEIMIRDEDQSAVISAIDALPPDRKALVWLIVAEGCTHAEASVIMDIPEGTARSRLHYTLKYLRNTMSRKEAR